MHALFRLPLPPAAALLLAAAPLAFAESPLPDPIAPAVIGRPLHQIGPAKAAKHKAAAKRAAARAAAAKRSAARQLAAHPAARTAVAAAPAAQAVPVAAQQQAPGTTRAAKQALDDRADPRMTASEVGKGTHFARKPTAAGAYFGDRHRSAARKYYEEHPVMRPVVHWKIGEPVPRDAVVARVPSALLAVLPKVPPGHQYVELGGDVVLIATGSKMVVDGIARGRGETAMVSRQR